MKRQQVQNNVQHAHKSQGYLQNRAARIIMDMSNDTDHSVPLQALGWKRHLKQKGRKLNQSINQSINQSTTTVE